jgi:histone acetyltransferase (RNA polymerase elongator complex component)
VNRLPFFLPMKNCPNRCIYCDQMTITGHRDMPSPNDVRSLASSASGPVETCFFGGSFTCLPENTRREYLSAAASAPPGSGIRISTHPDCIDPEALSILRDYPVTIVELGISSLDDKVLESCNRGYTGKKALGRISALIDDGRFIPGVQMMTGLPGQTPESSMEDLRQIAILKGNRRMQLRIYPCLVLANTPLEKLYRSGRYIPSSLEESARWAGEMIRFARDNGFELLRVGLQETESLGHGVVGGPHHPALGEYARSCALAKNILSKAPNGPWEISSRDMSLIFGHGGWGLMELARLSGLEAREAENRITWSDRHPPYI